MTKSKEMTLAKKLKFLEYAEARISKVSPIVADCCVDTVALCMHLCEFIQHRGEITRILDKFPELKIEINKTRIRNVRSDAYIYFKTPRYAVKGRLLLINRVRKQLNK